MKTKNLLLIAIAIFALCSCEKSNTNTNPVQSLDLVGTTWIAEDGKVMSGTDVLYYIYVEAVMLKDGNIATEDWISKKQLNLSGVTDLSKSGCTWYRCYNESTYEYSYPTVKVYDKATLFGSATIATDNKTATLVLTDATQQPATFYQLDEKRDIESDPWATTKWEGGTYIGTMVLGNYNKLAHIYLYQPEETLININYEYKHISGENVPYINFTYITTNGGIYQKEQYDYKKCVFEGHVENVPQKGYKFVYTAREYIKFPRYKEPVDIGTKNDTLNLHS